MATAFQSTAFQSNAFQEHGGTVGGGITGGLGYTNNNDAFAGAASVGASQVTGGWPTYYPRRRKAVQVSVERETQEEIQARLVEAQQRLALRKELRKAEQRDQEITAQLRAIYAEQDILARAVLGAEIAAEEFAKEEESLALILALAS